MDFKRPEDESTEQFNTAYDSATMADKQGISSEDQAIYLQYRSPLGDKLVKLWDQAERERTNIEERLLKDLRQYRGEYDPDVLAKMHPKRSKSFFNLTRPKVKTVSARMTDLLFPANSDKNWSIKTTPIPELNPQIIQNIMKQYQEQTGQQATEVMIRKFINDEAVRRCLAMEKEIEDQLAELNYREVIRNVILSGGIYGTGVLKGPLAKESSIKRWLPNGDQWVPVEIKKLTPWCEFVPIWDLYPDPAARTPDQLRYMFQRYIMNRNKVLELASRSDFNGGAIKSYLKAHPQGNAKDYKNYESRLMELNPAGSEGVGYTETSAAGTAAIGAGSGVYHNREGKYELKEFWGFLNTTELIQAGVELDEDELGLEVAANVWLLDDIVIKASISPIEGVKLPYHFYYYDKDDTSFWGEGIPCMMRDSQHMLNAAVRAMLDNAAISAGPIIEANMDLLDMSEDPRNVYPFRVFLRDGLGVEASAAALRVYKIPSYTNEFMAMINFFMTTADETTNVPRFMHGETNNVGGAGRTATGLSMLMGASNTTLKDQVKNFDDGITKKFIKGMYFWNMDFNPKEHIKGDFGVVARGSSSLVAREVKAESLNQFLAVTANEIYQPFIKVDSVLREMVKVMDLDDMDLIKDPNTVAIEKQKRDEQEAKDKQFAEELAIMKADSGGHTKGGQSERPSMERLSAEDLQGGQIPNVT